MYIVSGDITDEKSFTTLLFCFLPAVPKLLQAWRLSVVVAFLSESDRHSLNKDIDHALISYKV